MFCSLPLWTSLYSLSSLSGILMSLEILTMLTTGRGQCLFNWRHISGKLFRFLANYPAPSFTHWNSGWFLPLQLVNLSLCTAASCIFSATLLVPEITLSCRQSEIYNAHAMFGSSMTDVTFWMFSCTVFGMRELWNRSAVTKLEVKQDLRSCKWPGSVAAALMDFLTMFFFWEGGFLSRSTARDAQHLVLHPALLRLCLKSQLTKSSNHVKFTYLKQCASDSPYISLSYCCLAHGYNTSHTSKGQQL